MRRYNSFSFIGTCTLLAGIASSARADWPNFFGPKFDGKSEETGYKKELKEAPKPIWEKQVGSAFSSFAVVGDRLYTCGESDKQQTLLCLDANNGNVIWQTPFEKQYKNEHGDGTRATPTVDGDRVYVLGAYGKLICANAADGKVIWEKQFGNVPTWAYSGSVLIEGDLAVVSAGKGHGSLMAFEKKTGKEVWKTGDDLVGYATPYPFTFNNQRYIVGFMGEAAIIVEAKTGREVWRSAWKTDYNVNATMPIFHDGHLFLSSGYDTGCGLFKLAADGDKLKATEVWKNDVLLTKFQSCILHEGKLYVSDQNALKIVDFMTGKELFKQAKIKNGTMLLADGHFILLTEQGQLQIAKASGAEFNPLTKVSILDGRCWSTPVLHRGRLFARNLERIVCLDLN